MKQVRQAFAWIFLLNKRLFKKPGFLIILILVLGLVYAVGLMEQENSGAVTIAVTAEDMADPLALEIIETMESSSKLIRFVRCDDLEDVRKLVENGNADSAWVVHGELERKIDDFTQNIHRKNAFVTVIQREDTVLLNLTREKLYSLLYPYVSFSLYKNYVTNEISGLEPLTQEQYRAYYDMINAPGEELFSFSYANADESTADLDAVGYLLAPIRGLLSILVVLGGLAAAMFYMQDEAGGKFDWIPEHQRPLFAVFYHFTAIADVAAVALMALFLSGVSVSVGREILLMALFTILTSGFCITLRLLCATIHRLGTMIPVTVVAMLVFCPVFFNVRGAMRILSCIFPPYYYLNAVHNTDFILPMLICTAALYAFNILFGKIKHRG